jgi:hypothetical protein
MVFETIPMVSGTNTMGTKPETILLPTKIKGSSSKDLGFRKYRGLCNWDHGKGEKYHGPDDVYHGRGRADLGL